MAEKRKSDARKPKIKKLTRKELKALAGGRLGPCGNTAVTCQSENWNGTEVSCIANAV